MKPLLIFAALLLSVSGCIPSTQLAEGELNRYWSMTDDPTPVAKYHQPTFGTRKLPARWIIRQKPSVVLSTISIVRAFDKMKAGAETIDFSISPTHIASLIDVIGEARTALKSLSELADSAASSDRAHWADTMGQVLVRIERIARSSSIDELGTGEDSSADPMGLPAGPIMEILAMYLNESTDGALLKDLRPDDVDRLRVVLAQVVLRLGFDIAGKQLSPDLRQQVVELMRQADRPEVLQSTLSNLLVEHADHAPPVAKEAQAKKILRVTSTWGTKALDIIEAFISQWDRIERIELEFRRFQNHTIIVATISILPGKQVRLADMMIFQPVLVFRGTTRIVVIPELPQTRDTVILFGDAQNGAVEMRFEGLLYGLAKLFAFPLSDARLREVRVFTHSARRGYRIVNVSVLMEALGDKTDPRRLLVFQDVRKNRIVREAFTVRSIETKSEQIVNYFSSTRRYTYRRSKQGPDK